MNNMPPIRRTIKNMVHNYTDAQVKVREATSNDPWGPSSTIMTEIADLTYNVMAFSEIMQMVWRRLNDHGKNWRHVYKALVLLEYLIKTGSEKVAQQCKENIFAIQTLKDFQYIEENKDQGMNVREKAKQLVALLKDDEKLKNERTRALKAKERLAQNSSIGVGSSGATFGKGQGSHTGGLTHSEYGSPTSSPQHGAVATTELEAARPQTIGEEELQLQLALAMSKEEADQQDRMSKGDDMRLKMAISESVDDIKVHQAPGPPPHTQTQEPKQASLLDLDMSGGASGFSGGGGGDPWAPAAGAGTRSDPWGAPPAAQTDPWGAGVHQQTLPTGAAAVRSTDPWAPVANSTNGEMDGFDAIRSQQAESRTNMDSSLLSSSMPMDGGGDVGDKPKKKTPEEFLGENKNLVNLDSLISKPDTDSTNPFATTLTVTKNPFQGAPKPAVPMAQMKASPDVHGQQSNDLFPGSAATTQPTTGGYNPFL